MAMSENEALGRLTTMWSMHKKADPEMGEALKYAIDFIVNHSGDDESDESDD